MKKIGFIGQGWVGKNYADYFEESGFPTIRYALEEPYKANKDKITDCDIVFIAVPTPSTPEGFDDSIVRAAVKFVGKNKLAVIKSTILPGTTRSIQKENPEISVFHSPEFLREATARKDTFSPDRNIIGITENTEKLNKLALEVMEILPKAPYEKICKAEEAEITKYGGNNFLFWKVVFMNMLYDMALASGADWNVVAENLTADPRIGKSHMQPVHQSGRGAGGHCFIKDFAALSEFYGKTTGDRTGVALLATLRNKNIELLKGTGKDLDIIESIYGKII